jgi:hypothetical protein
MKWTSWVLALSCIIVFGLRLYIAFSSPGFSGDDAYFHLRQIWHIRETGLPLFHDPLSWGGRTFVFSPVFHYVIATGALIMPLVMAAKIIPNLLATLLMLIIYGIVQRVSKRESVAVFTAIFSAFVPVWFGHTINTLSPLTLSIPLLFLVIYAWMRADDLRWRYVYVSSLILFSFTSPLAFGLLIGLVLFLVLLLVEGLEIERTEIELALFSIFFVLWSQFLLYKKFILAHGPAVIWQNIPAGLLSSMYADVTILTAIYQIGILPVLYGVFVMYRYLFKRKHKMTYFLIAFALAAGALVWFRLVPVRTGLMLLGMFLLVLFSRWVDFFFNSMEKTRFHRWKFVFIASLVFAFVITGIVPSLAEGWAVQYEALSPEAQRAYTWINEQTPQDSVIVAAVGEGHRVTYLGNRKNIADSHFLLQHDAKQRVQDIGRVFSTRFGVEASELLERYHARYIMLSPETKEDARISVLAYAENSPCFGRAFDEASYILYVTYPFCKLEVVS